MNTRIKIDPPKNSPVLRGYNTDKIITLIVSNIYLDCGTDFMELVQGMDHVYTTELICSLTARFKMLVLDIPLCIGKAGCPINRMVSKMSGYNYILDIDEELF